MRRRLFVVAQLIVLVIAVSFDGFGGYELTESARALRSERAAAPGISWLLTAIVASLYWSRNVWDVTAPSWVQVSALSCVWLTVMSQIEFLIWPNTTFGPMGIILAVAASVAPFVLVVIRLVAPQAWRSRNRSEAAQPDVGEGEKGKP